MQSIPYRHSSPGNTRDGKRPDDVKESGACQPWAASTLYGQGGDGHGPLGLWCSDTRRSSHAFTDGDDGDEHACHQDSDADPICQPESPLIHRRCLCSIKQEAGDDGSPNGTAHSEQAHHTRDQAALLLGYQVRQQRMKGCLGCVASQLDQDIGDCQGGNISCHRHPDQSTGADQRASQDVGTAASPGS